MITMDEGGGVQFWYRTECLTNRHEFHLQLKLFLNDMVAREI